MPADHETLLSLLQERGPTPASQLRQALGGISQPTLSRLVASARSRLARIGRARATRYAVWRNVPGLGHSWPVYRIDESGRPHLAAQLHALTPGTWWYEAAGAFPAWLHGQFAEGLFPDLPWFLDDMRPQGFMGRAFARRYGELLGLGGDPILWSAADVLSALLRFGDDVPGDFVIGDAALERFDRAGLRPPECVPSERRLERYIGLAQAALAGDLPASSAGGEQPKFLVCVEEAAETYRHLIVKFSPARDTPAGRRWADLLVCEHLAAEAMRAHGIDACESSIADAGGRCFLEVARFDRVGRQGRRGFVSLMALSNAYDGQLDTWVAAADRLQRDVWLGRDHADALRVLWWLGGLIRNTDMHFGNITFALDSTLPLQLAPAYDMLPMHYRPTGAGEVLVREFEPPLPPPPQRRHWSRAAAVALTFWTRVAADTRISAEFRTEATGALEATHLLGDRFG